MAEYPKVKFRDSGNNLEVLNGGRVSIAQGGGVTLEVRATARAAARAGSGKERQGGEDDARAAARGEAPVGQRRQAALGAGQRAGGWQQQFGELATEGDHRHLVAPHVAEIVQDQQIEAVQPGQFLR